MWNLHRRGNMQCLSSGVWLMPLKWINSSYIHLPVNNRISSLRLSETQCTVLFMFKLSAFAKTWLSALTQVLGKFGVPSLKVLLRPFLLLLELTREPTDL